MTDPMSEPEPPQRLTYTVGEAALALGVSRRHAYQLVARGALPSLRLGRRLVVPIRAVEKLLDQTGGNHAA